MNTRSGTVPGFKRKTYHPVVRLGGFVAIIVGLWVIMTGVDLITSVLLALLIAVMVLMFMFNLTHRSRKRGTETVWPSTDRRSQ
jgi:uncharacterized membrane protein